MASIEKNEREELLNEILKLKKQLLWYKKTYDDRSLFGIIYDKIKTRKLTFLSTNHIKKILNNYKKIRIHISPVSSKLPKKILCTIINHNESANANTLFSNLSNYFDTVILDSGSINPPENAVKLSNIYYSALLNKSWEIAKNYSYTYLLLICSDVFLEPNDAQELFLRLSNLDYEKTGLYSPSSKGGSYKFCKKQPGSNLRIVPFVEGFMFLCDIKVLDSICPVNTSENLYGWGLDMAQGFYAGEQNKVCYIDDKIEVTHKTGTGYARETAEYEMLQWVENTSSKKLQNFVFEQITKPNE